jgi:hypothetical protein
VFTLATAEGRIADIIRTRILPVVFPTLAKLKAWREWMFRTVSQVIINYRGSPLSDGKAGDIHGGDRLPWVAVAGMNNYDSLAAMSWQAHIYGVADAELITWCKAHDLSAQVFTWQPKYAEAGFAKDALYLLRPDTYVALAAESGSIDALESYFRNRGINP